jgi:2'-5' RNA ligase
MQLNGSSVAELEDEFDRLWSRSRSLLMTGGAEVTTPPGGHESAPKLCVTTLVPLESQGGEAFRHAAEVQSALRRVAPSHYFYSPHAFHVTVIGCTPFFESRVAISDERVGRVARVCEAVMANWDAPLRLRVAGVGALAGSVFLQVFSPDGAFGRLRVELLRALKSAGEEPVEYLNPWRSHMNIMKFTAAEPAAVGPLVAAIESLRRVEVGEFEVRAIELVVTDRFRSAWATELIRQFTPAA